MSFAAGAAGGIAAYSLMRSMSGSYYSGPGYYRPGYGSRQSTTDSLRMNVAFHLRSFSSGRNVCQH